MAWISFILAMILLFDVIIYPSIFDEVWLFNDLNLFIIYFAIVTSVSCFYRRINFLRQFEHVFDFGDNIPKQGQIANKRWGGECEITFCIVDYIDNIESNFNFKWNLVVDSIKAQRCFSIRYGLFYIEKSSYGESIWWFWTSKTKTKSNRMKDTRTFWQPFEALLKV